MSIEKEMSIALPWAERPIGLEELQLGTGDYRYALTAGDFGFDPFGWTEIGWGLNEGETDADRLDRVYAYREAELKHSRLAMLAVVGWPISELFDGRLSLRLGLASDLVDPDSKGIGLAPSLLNGGLGKVSIVYWAVIVAVAAAIESVGKFRITEAVRIGTTRAPGDFGFDPLGLFPTDEEELSFDQAASAFKMRSMLEGLDERLAAAAAKTADDAAAVLEQLPESAPLGNLQLRRREMFEQELTHGRTAMLAIVGFVAQEFVTKIPVVEETPQFFFADENELEGVKEIEQVTEVSFDILFSTFKHILENAAQGNH